MCGCSVAVAWLLLRFVGQLAAQPTAAAQIPSEVDLQLDVCDSVVYDAAEVAELVTVELSGLGVIALRRVPQVEAEPRAPALALIRVGCGSVPSTLAVDVADLVSGNRLTRDVLLDDVESGARERALSIAVASVLESSWALLAARPPPQAAPGAAPMSEGVRTAVRRRLIMGPPPSAAELGLPDVSSAMSGVLTASLGARVFPSHVTSVAGVDLAIAPRLGRMFRWALDFEAMYGRQLVLYGVSPAGEVQIVWFSVGAALGVVTPTRPELQLGPTVRVAYARALTSSDSERFAARDGGGFMYMFGLTSTLRFVLGDAWALSLGSDVGYVPGGLTFRAADIGAISFADLSLVFRFGISRTL